MMKSLTMVLSLAALLMLMSGCQQPGSKEKGAATKTGYNHGTAQVKLNANRGKDPIFEVNPALFNAALDEEYVDIPDPVFFDSLIKGGVDQNGDNKISVAEAEAIGYCYIPNIKGLISMEGLQAFKNITKLVIFNTADLEILPLELPILSIFTLSGTNVKTISFDKTPKLHQLGLVNNSRMIDLNFEPIRDTLVYFTMNDTPNVTRLDFKSFTQLNNFIVYNMDNLLTFELPDRYENITDDGHLFFATAKMIEAFDLHLVPVNMLNVDIEDNASLKKVYVSAEQKDLFANSTSRWNIDNPDLFEVVS